LRVVRKFCEKSGHEGHGFFRSDRKSLLLGLHGLVIEVALQPRCTPRGWCPGPKGRPPTGPPNGPKTARRCTARSSGPTSDAPSACARGTTRQPTGQLHLPMQPPQKNNKWFAG
jgi:hypothetical protein